MKSLNNNTIQDRSISSRLSTDDYTILAQKSLLGTPDHLLIQTDMKNDKKGIEEQDALARSNQQLEQFAYLASHDLSDPLRKLSVFSESLEQKESERLSPEGKDLIQRIKKLTAQMQQLIDGILALSVSYDKQENESVNLNKVLENVRQNLSAKIHQSGAVIRAAHMPMVWGYESQLDQLFQNLIANSIRYARAKIAPIIEVTCDIVEGSMISGIRDEDKPKQFYKISLSDNGIGFDNKYAEKIFMIFQRLHGKSEYEGSGIGLAICKQVVEKHHGYITASGKVNEGAEFIIYLPDNNIPNRPY